MDDKDRLRQERPGGEHVWDLIERHGEDYLQEGKRLLRRLSLTIVIVGITVAVAILAIVLMVAYALLK